MGASGSQHWQAVSNLGWASSNGFGTGLTGYVTYSSTTTYCYDQMGHQNGSDVWYGNSVYHDPWGTAHSFSGYYEVKTGGCAPGGGQQTTNTYPGFASDGSGLTINSWSGPVITTNATNFGGTTVTDRNGNQLYVNSTGVFTDTLGTTVLTAAGSGTPTSPLTFTYTAPSGANAVYTMKYTAYTVQTKFSCSGISEYGPTSNNLVSEIDLPDYDSSTNPNARYVLTYEITPGDTHNPHYVTGRLASVTLPAGGTISYTYTGGSSGHIWCADGSASGRTRQTPDGTWTYTRSGGTITITDPTTPTGNQTVIQFQGLYETQRKIYQGSTSGTLLLTVDTCYNGSASPCTGTAVTPPFSQVSQIKTLPGASHLQCKHVTFYNTYALPTEKDDYDYGSAVGSLLKKTLITYATLGNNILDMAATETVQDGSGATKAQNTFAYDETAVVVPTGTTPQHTSVTGSRGNATTIKKLVQGSTFLTSTISYFDTGNPQTVTDVNGAATTYNYPDATSTCGNAFPTSITEPLSLSKSMTWNCTGAVMTQLTDENGKTTTTAYANDPYYWRPDSVTDPTSAAVSFCYGLLSNSTGTCTRNMTQVESTLNFNSHNSTVDSLMTVDSLGRPHVGQVRQSPSLTTFDSTESDYDALGRPSRSTTPYSANAGQTTSPTGPGVTATYDALGRPLTVADAGGGSVTYSYTNNDVLVTVGPAPSGENTKSRQFEYNSLGSLTSVCELTNGTTPWPGGTCAQNTSQTGYWTKYTLDALGDILTVTQNAQSSSNQQTRSYSFDAMRRLTSETNPETGNTSYTYDSDSTCGTFPGDLVKRVDAVGNTTCLSYDALHRKSSVTYPSGTYASVTPSKYFVYDSATVNSASMANAKGRLAEAYTCTSCPSTKLTDLGFSYTARGETSDVYELTPHSNSSYYHVSQTYWAHGAASQLSAAYNGNSITGLPTISYGGTIGSTVGLDGEGRITQVTAGSGQNPVTGVTYNNASLPTLVTLGSGDNDIFAYDSNTLRMTQFKFNVGTQSKYLNGALTWNANGTLGQLAVTDQFNSSNTQTCNYTHDDLTRIAQVDCGSGGWGQAFGYVSGQNAGYDAFGNLTKNVLSSHTGDSFQPTYSATTNQFASVPGCSSLSYDSNGNLKNDCNHTYTWDADGNSITVDSVSLTFDALDRMVEQNRSGTYTQVVYGPGGGKLALMTGQTLQKAFVSLPGQAAAVYTGSGLDHYRHSDWLGSTRLSSSSPSRGYVSSLAYAPYGETYASSGTTDPSLTGMNPDTTSGDYDFLAREYSNEGRWVSPDPAGLAAVNPSNPQSWNRYSYVLNNPLTNTDPTGLYCVYLNDEGDGVESIDDSSSSGDCGETGGYWIAGEFGGASQISINADLGLVSGYGYLDGAWQYSVAGALDSNPWGAWTQTVGNPSSGGGSGGSWFWTLWSSFWAQVPWSATVVEPLVTFGPNASGGVGITVAYNPKSNKTCIGGVAGAQFPAAGRSVAAGPLVLGNLNNADAILTGPSVNAGVQSPNPLIGVNTTANSSGWLAGPTVGTAGIFSGPSASVCSTKITNLLDDALSSMDGALP